MIKKYSFKEDTEHQAIIFEIGSKADTTDNHTGFTKGLIVGSSEWGWISEDNGRRICAALQYFSETDTDEIEQLAEEKLNE